MPYRSLTIGRLGTIGLRHFGHQHYDRNRDAIGGGNHPGLRMASYRAADFVAGLEINAGVLRSRCGDFLGLRGMARPSAHIKSVVIQHRARFHARFAPK